MENTQNPLNHLIRPCVHIIKINVLFVPSTLEVRLKKVVCKTYPKLEAATGGPIISQQWQLRGKDLAVGGVW